MPHLTPEAHECFARQHGVASLEQLLHCGLPLHDIKRIRRAGGLDLVLQGAYHTPSTALDELARCAAVCLAHPDLAIAGPTAGRLWGFRRLPDDRRIHVLAPPASHPTMVSWVVPYRTAAVHEADIVQRPDGIRVTSRLRTALDLTRWLDGMDLRSVIDQALHDGRHESGEATAVAADWVTPGRAWVRRFLRQVERRGTGMPAESHHELLLGEALERAGVRGLLRQHEIDLPDYGCARFDLAVPRLRWAIEIDVHPVHREAAGIESDRCRDAAATKLKWTVTRVPPDGFGHALADTVERLVAIHRSLAERDER